MSDYHRMELERLRAQGLDEIHSYYKAQRTTPGHIVVHDEQRWNKIFGPPRPVCVQGCSELGPFCTPIPPPPAPRKQIWLPGFRTHVWVGFVVMCAVAVECDGWEPFAGWLGLGLLGAFLFAYDEWPKEDS